MNEEPRSVEFRCLQVKQPIGDFYIASVPYKELIDITYFDVRRVMQEQRDIERYLGIQRPLNNKRVEELEKYVETVDACFPTGIIIAVSAESARWNSDSGILELSNRPDLDPPILFRKIARVLDGQHRLAGLGKKESGEFDLNVAIFVDADLADQAMIFSTVNLAQTKVQKSLGYDLYDLATVRSPQKFCHQMTVTLDKEKSSPLYKMIKRLGVATPGRTGETLTQATVVQSFLPFISVDEVIDRDLYLRGRRPEKINSELLKQHPFQHLFVDEKDFEIIDIVWNYFEAVSERWPEAWMKRAPGWILNRTNGFRALVRLLRYIYVEIRDTVPSVEQYLEFLRKVNISDDEITTEKYQPGTSGESLLFREMRDFIRGEPH